MKKKQKKFKSKFEGEVSRELARMGVKAEYEPFSLTYIVPTERHRYTPDFVPAGTKIIIESKGKLTIADRKKLLLLKEQYPDHKFCLLFQNAYNRLNKNSNTTYAEWCEKHGLEWADFKTMKIPRSWF